MRREMVYAWWDEPLGKQKYFSQLYAYHFPGKSDYQCAEKLQDFLQYARKEATADPTDYGTPPAERPRLQTNQFMYIATFVVINENSITHQFANGDRYYMTHWH